MACVTDYLTTEVFYKTFGTWGLDVAEMAIFLRFSEQSLCRQEGAVTDVTAPSVYTFF